VELLVSGVRKENLESSTGGQVSISESTIGEQVLNGGNLSLKQGALR
jgi:hypothetical protein